MDAILKRAREEDTEFLFFHVMGNALFPVQMYEHMYARTGDPEAMMNLVRVKRIFYERLDAFEESGYRPNERINPASVARIHEFKRRIWTGGTLEELKSYMHSMKVPRSLHVLPAADGHLV
ncbi:MAG: hypothetical protein HYS81_00150 [Candidatus Aenigmatarchaeota archaeon]|nr:MAG: hypothetical protein HYS81_00150 [Candidatus Aenigmarchaeota archaeon]